MKLFRQNLSKSLRFLSLKSSRSLSSPAATRTSPMEEELGQGYDPGKYYPARIGETIDKYLVISKLGWGANSTAWLAKDTSRWARQSTRYVTLKITNSGDAANKAAEDELEISNHISGLGSEHQGLRYIRLVKESFRMRGMSGDHICLVFEPLREPLWLLGRHLGSAGVPPKVLKAFLKILLLGLDFLHSECHVIHTDLKADNFLIVFEDAVVLKSYVNQQERDPAPHVFRNGRPVFESRPDFGPLRRGCCCLRHVPSLHNHEIQPQPFCAPEVLLRAGWTYSANIWNLGTMLWELLAETTLFDGICPDSALYSREAHIAQMIRLLGPPPPQLLSKCDPGIHDNLFSSQGTFKFPHLVPSEDYNLSNLTPFLDGEDKRLFIEFVLRMLQWEPERRSSAKQLFDDPWLSYNYP
ncbi:kinase domain protein [Penicillium bovifimosum]|uniref:non-specific serine/threonine protein kinase n=1 Tax=Penicillium bovifimosum TaxID=126998 RepID=A0A9W9H095_9EURO|nr:kinase domain protein [Penicillium bovifimosum]KAJ5135234.1 kinase domain protein [Penicillium bovifimosum]